MASASAPEERPRRGRPSPEPAPARLSDDDVDRIVDALERRILVELDRRGGRFAGRL